MGRVKLKVLTVPAFDSLSLCEYTAYTVMLQDDKQFLCASGWTLRDAIETFCDRYKIERGNVSLIRPFFPQILYYYE